MRSWGQTARRVSRRALERLAQPAVGFVLAGGIYAWVAAVHSGGFTPSSYAYFTFLADAFLHGQLHLRLLPDSPVDLSTYDGKVFLYWPPFPAVVSMPLVALFGLQTSDVAMTVVLGAANVALVAALLRSAVARRVVRLTRAQRGWLVLFFAFGTVHFTLAPFGRVWFTAQVIGFCCLALAYWAAIHLRSISAFALAGAAVGAAFLTRNHLLFAGLWPAAYLLHAHRAEPRGRLAAYVLAGLVPVAAAIGLLLLYNDLRFGSPLENGLQYHKPGGDFQTNMDRYGAFSLHYLPTNFYYQYLYHPLPYREGSHMGGGLFWMSPVFLAAALAFVGQRARWSAGLLTASCALVAVPILLLMGTGYVQFGPRYTLDFTVPLLLLTAMGLRRAPRVALPIAVALAMVQYTVGALRFMREL